jgi:transposase-like protein
MARQLEVKQSTAWFLCQRIRESWNQQRFILDGEVEMDETYNGGLERNKHASKRLHAGRGGVEKMPVIGSKRRKGGMFAVVATVANKKALREIIDPRVSPDATRYTEDHRGYFGAPKKVRARLTVNHSKGEYVRGCVSTNGVESFELCSSAVL